MRMKKTMITLAAALAASAALAQSAPPQSAQPPREAPPAAAAPKNFTLADVHKFELPNGLRVRLVPYGSVPKVTVELVVQTGAVDEGAQEVWLSRLVANMMQQGTTTQSSEQIARKAAMMGSELQVNAGVNQSTIAVDVLADSGPAAVDLIADVARNPRFPESELPRLEADLSRQLAISLSQQQTLASKKWRSVVYPDQAYGRLYPTDAMAKGYSLDQVRGFYDRNFGAARATVYVAGRFDPVAIEQAVRRDFSDWKRGNAATTPTVTATSKRGLYLVDRPGAVQSTLVIGLPTINPDAPDYVPLIVTDAILGGSFGSRITSNIREQKGYTYSPSSSVATRLGADSWAEFADVTTNVTGPAIKEILAEIDRLRNEPPTAAEVAGIQHYLAGTFVLRNSSRTGLINQLAFVDLYGLGEGYLRNYVQRLYAVTPADVQRVAQQDLDPSKLTIVVVGDRKVVATQLEPFGSVAE